jgi:hypothetical protein
MTVIVGSGRRARTDRGIHATYGGARNRSDRST